ncbi:MAG: TlpA disulfide reductase family protein [Bacteroidota bacterium]
MDKIEQFFHDHREGFDALPPKDSDWAAIQHKLDQPRGIVRRPYFYGIAAALLALVIIAGIFIFNPQTEQAQDVVGLEINNIFPDIALRNPDGQRIPISSMKGKVVLVEFWASYSMVCTERNCFYFKPLYKEFKDKGFEIYAISVDSSAVNWMDAIERDQLEWVQVADLSGQDSPLVQRFAIDQLPMTFLLDEEGRIIDKNVDASKLKSKLDQLFAYN